MLSKLKKFLGYCVLSIGLLLPMSVEAQPKPVAAKKFTAAAKVPFSTWLKNFKKEAKAKGFSPAIVDAALPDSMQPIPSVIQADKKQPEIKQSFADYVKARLSSRRVDTGMVRIEQHRELLNRASEKYGVDAEVLVALWGIETNYGTNVGTYSVPRALATLAHDDRRAAYFREELFNALRILQQGHIKLEDFKGSWAGAMGQNQFMPSSFFTFAADGDGDGKRDIWKNHADIFASSANYLSKCGWNKGENWGRKIDLPAGFDTALITRKDQKTWPRKHSLKFWHDKGVRMPDGSAIPADGSASSSIIQPDGPGTQAYIVYDNFQVIMRWNNSRSFAAAVGSLSDKFR